MVHKIFALPFIALCLSGSAVFTAPAFAQEGEPAPAAQPQYGMRFSRIEVIGNQRVEARTIQTYLGLEADKTYSADNINAAFKRLFGTGFFSDVKLTQKGSTLNVYVTENPIVNKVVFEGNDQLKDDDLRAEVALRSRAIYTRTQVQNDVKRILDLYRSNGRYSATVTPKVIALDQNRVNLVYEIAEGPVTRIEKISFIGNEKFDSDTLRNVIRSEEHRWYKFFSSDNKYDADRMLYDQELLRRYYVSRGYADFQIKSTMTELTPDKQGFYLTFVLDEGEKYAFGKVGLENRLTGSESVGLEGALLTKEGKIFNAAQVEDSVEQMVQVLGDAGFAFVDISPELDRHPENRTIDVTYQVREGKRVYIERINVNGNSRTLDEVVRREFRVAEGDAYNTSQLRRSEQRLNNLGFFESVKISEKRGSADDKIVIDTDVKERSTGEVSFGVGYSTLDGPLVDMGIREKNLLGRGQELRLRGMIATERQQIDLGFTEPYFLDRDIQAGFDVYRITQDMQQESSFDREMNGFTLRMNYALTEMLRHTVNYNLRETTVSNVEPWASRFIRDQEGTTVTSSVGQAFTYDSRDNRFDPTSGWLLRLNQELAGLGGDTSFLRHEGRVEYFYPVAKGWTLQLLGLGGHVFGLGKDVGIQDRFFIGGREIRGFDNAGIGPRDSTTTDALGGNTYYAGTAELRFPLGLPSDSGITGAVFTDFGSLWGVDDHGPEVVDSRTVRASAGFGVAWSSPFGPIRIDFAKSYMQEDEDEDELIRFNFGSRF